MSAPAPARVTRFFRRAGLFAAVLALMAGIFGMHVMTSTHALHSPATAAAAVSAPHASSSPAAHTGEHAPRPVSAPAIPAAHGDESTTTAQCTESGSCTGMRAMTAACTPSAKAGSLAAPLPGTAVIAWAAGPRDVAAISEPWSYRPGSPSPGELCISRT